MLLPCPFTLYFSTCSNYCSCGSGGVLIFLLLILFSTSSTLAIVVTNYLCSLIIFDILNFKSTFCCGSGLCLCLLSPSGHLSAPLHSFKFALLYLHLRNILSACCRAANLHEVVKLALQAGILLLKSLKKLLFFSLLK